jgi:hypothetical protein
MVIHPAGEFWPHHEFSQQAADPFGCGFRMALLDAADGEGSDGLVQVVEQREFLSRRHAADECDL